MYMCRRLPIRSRWPTAVSYIPCGSPRVGPSTTRMASLRDCRMGPHNLRLAEWLHCTMIVWARNVYVLLPADPLELAHSNP
jgi:hypothetical protein